MNKDYYLKKLLVTIFLGYFGVHKFMEGKIGTGILYLFTGGLFGIGYMIDIVTAAIDLGRAVMDTSSANGTYNTYNTQNTYNNTYNRTTKTTSVQQNRTNSYSIKKDADKYDTATLVKAIEFSVDREYVNVYSLADGINVTAVAADKMLNEMVKMGIISERHSNGEYHVLISRSTWEHMIETGSTTYIRQNLENSYYEQFQQFDTMSQAGFVSYCAELLKKSGFTDIAINQTDKNFGANIIATKDTVSYAIRCIQSADDLGENDIIKALEGKAYYDTMVCAVLTNRFFTQKAKDMAQDGKVMLWNRDQLIKMIEKDISGQVQMGGSTR